jgi:hypothetical protein
MTAKPLNVIALILPLIVTPVLNSCTVRDTCSSGDNMTNPRVARFDPGASTPSLLIVWDVGTGRGAELPETYFEKVKLADDGQDAPPITSVEYRGGRELIVTFGNLESYLSSRDTLSFVLEFPDRLGYINCSHPGMMDRYQLRVTMTFTSNHDFVNAQFEQIKNLGAL